MTSPELLKARKELEWRQRFVSDVFHSLSQPLTALHCSLELALRKKNTVDQCRQALRDALSLAASAIESAKFIRLLAEAEDPGELKRLNLSAAFRQVLEELEPITRSQGVSIESTIAQEIVVAADSARLTQVFLVLLDRAMKHAGLRQVRIESQILDADIIVTITAGVMPGIRSASPIDANAVVDRGLILAERMVHALQGELGVHHSADGFGFVLRLPQSAGHSETGKRPHQFGARGN